jgi:hypothetical protein
VGFLYALRLSDGSDAGEASYAYGVNPGDEIRVEGNQRMRVLSVIPAELAAEFVDGAVYAVLEVEPV